MPPAAIIASPPGTCRPLLIFGLKELYSCGSSGELNPLDPAGDSSSHLIGAVLLQEVEALDFDALLIGETAGQLPDPPRDEHTRLRVDKELRQRRRPQPSRVRRDSVSAVESGSLGCPSNKSFRPM